MSVLIDSHHDAVLSDSGFARLEEVFADHLGRSRGGMAFCVYRDGKPLARLYGGSVTRRDVVAGPVTSPWTDSTMAVMFSGTKGVTATVAAILVDQGLLDVERRVADYWPEFAAAGKGDVRVFHLLNHTVGMPYVDPEPEGEFGDLDNAENARILAAQEPLWEPGAKVAYHAITYGYLLQEVFARITGKSVGTLFRELIADPLGLEIYLGLPDALDHRLATVFRADDYAISTYLTDPERRKIVDRMYGKSLIGENLRANSKEWHRAEIAAGGGIATADAMASLYSQLANGSVVSPDALADATRTWSEGLDVINDRPLRFGLGYELVDPIGTYGPVESAFGHSGAGGGLHGAWPEHNLGFSFLINAMLAENQDFRAKDLLQSLSEAL